MQFVDDDHAQLVQIVAAREKSIDDAVRLFDRADDDVTVGERVRRMVDSARVRRRSNVKRRK